MPLVPANIFQPLIDAFDWVITTFHDKVGLSWGMSIIALTVVVRAILVPLTVKQFKSMAALQQHAPQIKALQQKYKDDRQRLNQEMMKFYQENKVNPFGSCLPLLLQLPVFLSLFYMLRKDLKQDICGDAMALYLKAHQHATFTGTGCDKADPGSAGFGFIPDLTAPSTGKVLIALLVLYVVSQLGSSVLMSVTADRNQRMIMIGLPFVFVLFIQNFPAGLLVYWITTNFWTVGQQYLVRRYIGHHPSPATAGAGGADPPAPTAATAAAVVAGGAPKATPPPPPRKKKKRSGRRR
jgi:YidC/Oxa1 family membrane protein insertase